MSRATDTIAARTQQMLENLATQMPAQAAQTFEAEQAGLEATGRPEGVATAGAPMPDGKLLDVHGNPTSLSAARGGRPAVVVFYRGAWCPYCNVALRSYQDHLVPALTDRGAALIAISPQKPDGSLSMAETNELTFTVLSDPGNQISAALGILTAPTADAVDAQSSLGLDLTELNADGTRSLPMPTVAVLDAAGTISWIDTRPNYGTRTEPGDIITAYDGTA